MAQKPKPTNGAKRTSGRPSLYKKEHRTQISQSLLVRDELLPDLEDWIPGVSRSDLIERAVREFHRDQKRRRDGA